MKETFDGLTEKEREAIKELGRKAMEQYLEALRQYNELFGENKKAKN